MIMAFISKKFGEGLNQPLRNFSAISSEHNLKISDFPGLSRFFKIFPIILNTHITAVSSVVFSFRIIQTSFSDNFVLQWKNKKLSLLPYKTRNQSGNATNLCLQNFRNIVVMSNRLTVCFYVFGS